MKYRVHYPLLTQATYRDFATRKAANAFAEERRLLHVERKIPALTKPAWVARGVYVEQLVTDIEEIR